MMMIRIIKLKIRIMHTLRIVLLTIRTTLGLGRIHLYDDNLIVDQ